MLTPRQLRTLLNALRLGPPGFAEAIADHYGVDDSSPDSLIGLTELQAAYVCEFVVENYAAQA